MNRVVQTVLSFAVAIACCLAASSAAIASGPSLSVRAESDTTVAPGSEMVYHLEVVNFGDEATAGEVELLGELPDGIVATESTLGAFECAAYDGGPLAAARKVRCVTTRELAPTRSGGGEEERLNQALVVKVEAAAPQGPAVAHFEAKSGGAAPGAAPDQVTITTQKPRFGIAAFDSQLNSDASGSLFKQAGGHPYSVTTEVDLNTYNNLDQDSAIPPHSELLQSGDLYPVEPIKDVLVDLPDGLVANPGAVETCTADQLGHSTGVAVDPLCPPGSQVGVIKLRFAIPEINETISPLFNMVPPPGVPARFGFNALGTLVLLDGRLRHDGAYGLSVDSRDIGEGIALAGVTTVFWGVPADPSHDAQRWCDNEKITEGCPANVAPVPFLRAPTSCNRPGEGMTWAIHGDSWFNPGSYEVGAASVTDPPPNLNDPNWHSGAFQSHEAPEYPYRPDEWGASSGIEGCESVPVKAALQAQPTALETETPTGLGVDVEVPNPGLENPTGIASSDLKAVKVTLPVGVTINPSQAEGLGVCTPARYASTELSFHPDPSKGCPSDAKIGTVVMHTPLLEEPVEGDVFVAAPHDNPFGTLLALYLVLENPQRGILIKQAGKVELDPVTGQITTSFSEIPQLPFASFDFKFREGARAPLVTPALCGSYATNAVFTPWSDPAHTVESQSRFEIVRGIGGSACPSGGAPPFAPQVVSGTLNNNAGSYTPFDLHIARQDGEQELTRFSTVLPPGVTGNLTGIPFCPDAAVEAARHKTGAQELAQPSCPAASEIGHTIVGAGVGSVLAHTPGKVYLAGSYHGSNLSIVSITSATVGPFDLGTVVIRFGLRINPTTAQVEVDATGSDAIPHIIDGIVVHVRDIRVYIDRPGFIRNPTSCSPSSILSTITGAGADFTDPAAQNSVNVNTRFQAANCSLLGFKPTFKASTSGKPSRLNGASLHVTLTYPKAPEGSQANIRSVKVLLPKQLPSRLTTLQKACIDTTFNQNPAACPAASRVGFGKAITPILPEPLAGPAYFVSHGGAKFPELIVVLQGYGITIDLHGETFISKQGITSSTFATVPDQPVSSFELTLPQGPNSALAANGNLCKTKLKMPTTFTAQNGATIKQATTITPTGCSRHASKHHKHKKHKRAKAKRHKK